MSVGVMMIAKSEGIEYKTTAATNSNSPSQTDEHAAASKSSIQGSSSEKNQDECSLQTASDKASSDKENES